MRSVASGVPYGCAGSNPAVVDLPWQLVAARPLIRGGREFDPLPSYLAAASCTQDIADVVQRIAHQFPELEIAVRFRASACSPWQLVAARPLIRGGREFDPLLGYLRLAQRDGPDPGLICWERAIDTLLRHTLPV